MVVVVVMGIMMRSSGTLKQEIVLLNTQAVANIYDNLDLVTSY